MAEVDLSPAALTKEKSLWQVYLQARRIPTNRFNAIATFLIFLISVATCWFSQRSTYETITLVRRLADFGYSSTLSLLGFLVAGFTIFATVSNPAMMVRMSEKRHTESGLSHLKFSFFVLIRVFMYYMSYAFFCFVVIYLGSPKGFVSFLVGFSAQPQMWAHTIANIGFVVLVSGQFFLLMQLKSFVFNIHHSVMASIRWRAEGHD